MIRLATVFSGIGAIESALKYDGFDYNLVFACDNGERELNLSYDEIVSTRAGSAVAAHNRYAASALGREVCI